MTPLYERYRPGSLDDFAGNPKAVGQARRLIESGAGGNAVWISGPSGTGKTTLARIIAASAADPKWATIEVDAGSVSAENVRDWSALAHKFGWPGPNGQTGRAWIVNEAHGLRAATIRAMLVWLEALPGHCVVIFTTTRDGHDKLFDDQMDAGPLVSRCHRFALTSQGLSEAFAERAHQIATREGLNGQPAEKYRRFVLDRKNNMRAVLQDIADGAMIAE